MQLGACLVERGEDEEAQRALERGGEVTSADDIVDVVGLAALEAVLRARRGELGEVQELARRALARADETGLAPGVAAPTRGGAQPRSSSGPRARERLAALT